MSYSCSDFTDSIIDALKVTPMEADSPSDQADICLAEIERLQRFEQETRHALAVFADSKCAAGLIRRLAVVANVAIEPAPLHVTVVMEGGICQGVITEDTDLIGQDYRVIDYDTEGSDEGDRSDVRQSDGSISEAIVGGGYIELASVKIEESEEEEA